MTLLILLTLLTTSLYYLGGHAKITQPIWSRYPKWLDDYMLCPWCTGFAFGTLLGIFAFAKGYSFIPWDAGDPITPLFTGAISIVLTPIGAGIAFFFFGYVPQKEERAPAAPPNLHHCHDVKCPRWGSTHNCHDPSCQRG